MALPLSYHWRSLFVRKTTTVLTVLVVAAVVGVFAWMLGFADALRRSMEVASATDKIIVLKRGASSESSSAIPVDEFNRLAQVRDLARDPGTDAPLLSPEMLVQVQLPRLRDGGRTWTNVAVRGVTPMAFAVHNTVKVTGAMFAKGAPEVIAGAQAAQQFTGLNVGDLVPLGNGADRPYRVVGTFTAGGGPFESEIWGYLPSLMSAYQRTMYSSASLLLRPGADFNDAIEQVEGPAIQLHAQTEAQYWREQSQLIRAYLVIARVLVAIMCVAAIISIANTMFAAVAGRTNEIAMLRTIGYSRRQILGGMVVEAVMLAVIGGVVGCALCAMWLELVSSTKDVFGANTFTTLAFEIRLTPEIFAIVLGAVVAVGALGAFVPARRAARINVISALRET